MCKIKRERLLFLILLAICICATGQKPKTVYDIFTKASISIFDYTTEGISIEEKNDLLKKGESKSWKIVSKSDKKIVIDCKYPSSQVILFLLEKQNGSPLLVSYTENEKVRNIDIWELNDKGVVEKIDLLPVILARDFFSKENQFYTISDYNNNVYYYFDTITNLIHAGLFLRMERELEEKNIDFDVILNWNGKTFEVHKVLYENK